MTKDHPTSSPPSPELVSELHRLVGRNSLRYQRIEIIIKKLLQFLSLTVEIGPNGDASIISEQDHKLSTLGTIAKEFMKVYENSNNINEPKTLITNNFIISTRIKISTDDQELDKLNILMSNVINQRNYMIHHLLSEIISEDPSSISKAMQQLEISFNQANTLLEELNQVIKSIQEIYKFIQDSNFVDII